MCRNLMKPLGNENNEKKYKKIHHQNSSNVLLSKKVYVQSSCFDALYNCGLEFQVKASRCIGQLRNGQAGVFYIATTELFPF